MSGEGREGEEVEDGGEEWEEASEMDEEPFVFPRYRYAEPVRGQHDVDVRVLREKLRAEEVCRGATTQRLCLCSCVRAVVRDCTGVHAHRVCVRMWCVSVHESLCAVWCGCVSALNLRGRTEQAV
jgi:hypothetical protein